MNNPVLKRGLSVLLAILLLVYIGYQIYLINRKEIYTEEATYASVSDSVQTTGFAVRDETVIESVYSGVLNYNAADGDRVSNGSAIANIYANEKDAMAQGQLARIESEIQMLKAISNPGDSYISNPELIGDQINTALDSLLLTAKDADYSNLSVCRDDFQMAVNRRNIITGVEKAEDYSLRISELEAEKTALTESMGSLIGTITANKAGYFMSTIDGYEDALDISKVQNMTVDEVDSIINMAAPDADKYCVGKICSDFTWYMVAVIDKNEMVKFGDTTLVTIEAPFVTSEKIPAEIVAKNHDIKSDKTAVIFKCTYMNSQIASIRNETIQINIKDYSGVLVTEKAIHFNDIETVETDDNGNEIREMHENVKGVYIKNGNELKFVQIYTYKTINGYAICKTELTENEEKMLVTDSTISLYDKVIVGGIDLYDGKLIE